MTEIQDIIKEHGDNYKEHNELPYNKLKALESIEVCRTDVLGKHVSILFKQRSKIKYPKYC
jgi:hypothetical protein